MSFLFSWLAVAHAVINFTKVSQQKNTMCVKRKCVAENLVEYREWNLARPVFRKSRKLRRAVRRAIEKNFPKSSHIHCFTLVFALKKNENKYFLILKNKNLVCFPEIAGRKSRKFYIQNLYKRCIQKSKIFGVTAFRRHRNQSWAN